MKQNRKQYLKTTTLLLGLCFLAFNCQKDDYLKDMENGCSKVELPFLISKIGSNEINKNKNILQELQKIEEGIEKKKTELINKTIYLEEYDFHINTDYAKYIENVDGSYHSYTFPIERPVETDVLENLVLSLKQDGTYKILIMSYAITAQERIAIKNDEIIDLEGKTSTVTLDNLDIIDTIFNKDLAPPPECYIYNYLITPCLGGYIYPHTTVYNSTIGGPCGGTGGILVGSTADLACIEAQNDSGQQDTGTTNTTGTGQGTGTDSNPPSGEDMTSPIVPCIGSDCPEIPDPIHDKNCAELHRLSTAQEAADEFNQQESDILTSVSFEKGFQFLVNPNNPYFQTYPVQADSECKAIDVSENTYTFCIMHIHPVNVNCGTHPMFADGDIASLYKMYAQFNASAIPNYQYDSSLFTVFMTVENNHYAIKINDINRFENVATIFNNPTDRSDFIRRLKSAYENASNDTFSTTPTQLELTKAFLKFIGTESNDIGISLYKSTHEDVKYVPNLPQEEQTSNWKKLTLDGNTITEIDCN